MGNKGKLTALAVTSPTTCAVNPPTPKKARMLRNEPPRAHKYVALSSGYRQAADTLEGLARALRDRSAYMDHCANEVLTYEPHKVSSPETVLAVVNELLAQGIMEGRAISLAATRLALPYDLTVRQLQRGRKEARDRQRDTRNRRIMQRAALGWTNQDIAEAEGLHRQTVARIVSVEKKRARPKR